MEATDKYAPTQGKVKISPLRFVDVLVNGKAVRALKDSGAQIPPDQPDSVTGNSHRYHGQNRNRWCGGVGFGAPHNVGIQLAAEPGTINVSTAELPVVCGIVDLYDKVYDVILPADVVSDLLQLPAVSVCVAECVNDAANVGVAVPSVQVTSTNADTTAPLSDTNVSNAEFVNHSSQRDESLSVDANRLLHEQQQDETLSDCWSMARQSKGNFVISRGLLYRNDKVEGQPVCQLCVPTARRDAILKLAHDSVYSGHLGERKTRERIKLSFYWPTLKKSVRDYLMSCQDCQLRARKLTSDRVPITPITRDQVPFQTLSMDCIGPLDPPSAQGHKYCCASSIVVRVGRLSICLRV